MQRVTITIDDELLVFLDGLCDRQGYGSRSEAVRDLIRKAEAQEHGRSGSEAPCVAALAYTFEHGTRKLAQRITDDQHEHFDLSIATLHVHLNHYDCLEVAVLRGAVSDVRAFADTIITQKGVRHGNLHVIPQAADHAHEDG